MARRKPLTSFDRVFLILFGTIVGLGLLREAVFQKIPARSDLLKVSGPLAGYSIYKPPGHHSATLMLTIDGAPHRYWTDAVSGNEALELLRGAAQVSLYSYKK